MNGINAGKLNESEFKRLPPEEQNWVLYRAIEATQQGCAARLSLCDKRYVLRSWFKTKLAFLSGAGIIINAIGIGVILKLFGVL